MFRIVSKQRNMFIVAIYSPHGIAQTFNFINVKYLRQISDGVISAPVHGGAKYRQGLISVLPFLVHSTLNIGVPLKS